MLLALLLPPSPFELLWLHLFRIDSKSLDSLQSPSATRTANPLITCKAFGCMIVLAIASQRTRMHTVSFGSLEDQITRILTHNYSGTLCSREECLRLGSLYLRSPY